MSAPSRTTDTAARARLPDETGFATANDGLRLYWEIHGAGDTTIVLLPASPIGHMRLWKPQLHYLARGYRVVTYDGRGNGLSDFPDTDGPWLGHWRTTDCLAVMDATATDTAVLVGICINGVWPSVQIAAAHPERVRGIVGLAPGVPLLAPENPWWEAQGERVSDEAVREDYAGFLQFFWSEMFPEPHSEKQIEDAVEFGLASSAAVNTMSPAEPVAATQEEAEAICRQVRCPVLVVQGERDNCQCYDTGVALA